MAVFNTAASSIRSQVSPELRNAIPSHNTWFVTCCQDDQRYLPTSPNKTELLRISVTMCTGGHFIGLIRSEGGMWVMAFPSRPSRSEGTLCLYTVLTAGFEYVISCHVTCPLESRQPFITAAQFFWAVLNAYLLEARHEPCTFPDQLKNNTLHLIKYN